MTSCKFRTDEVEAEAGLRSSQVIGLVNTFDVKFGVIGYGILPNVQFGKIIYLVNSISVKNSRLKHFTLKEKNIFYSNRNQLIRSVF